MFKSLVILILLSLCVGTAAWLIFIWAVKRGDYEDVEGPKYRMLDDDAGADDASDATEGEHHE
ncbi:MAG: cbb3-type cytochrome oxidase assembly protein CcoS [Desulfuromonadales bacterium]|jgi:cbb3-type cytochrome oxidase maturation protein